MKKILLLLTAALLFVSCANPFPGDVTTEPLSESNTARATNGETMDTEDTTTKHAPVTDVDITEIGNIGFGFTEGNSANLTDEIIRKFYDAGIKTVRIVFLYPFSDVEGTTLSQNFSKARALAIKLYNSGFTVLGQTFWPGGWGANASTGEREWLNITGIPKALSDYSGDLYYEKMEDACYYMAKSLRKYVSYWLVSNEPNVSVYTGPMTDAQIIRFIRSCTEGLKAGNPNAKCGVNLLSRVDQARFNFYLRQLYGKNGFLDWVGLDGYFGSLQAGGPETWNSVITDCLKIITVPIIITEWSYPSPETDPLNTFPNQWDGHERGVESQAEYVAECISIFASYPEVIGAFWYQMADAHTGVCWECGQADCRLYSDWGLLYTDKTEKPAFFALSEAIKKITAENNG